MYVVKNAFRFIKHHKVQSILVFITVIVISAAVFVGLSIHQSCKTAKAEELDKNSITASISFDPQSIFSNIMGNMKGFDFSKISEMMNTSTSLLLSPFYQFF